MPKPPKPPTPRESMPRMEIVTVRLLPHTIAQVDAIAKRQRVTGNAIKRRYIEEGVQRELRGAK